MKVTRILFLIGFLYLTILLIQWVISIDWNSYYEVSGRVYLNNKVMNSGRVVFVGEKIYGIDFNGGSYRCVVSSGEYRVIIFGDEGIRSEYQDINKTNLGCGVYSDVGLDFKL